MSRIVDALRKLVRVVVIGRDQTLRHLFNNAGFEQVEIFRHLNYALEVVQAIGY